MMTDKELLSRALTFDAGPVVVLNGKLITEEVVKAYPDDFLFGGRNNIRVCYRGSDRWAIYNGTCCLSKATDDWEYEPMNSNMTEEYLKACRFDSLEEAFEFLEKWRERETARFLKGEELDYSSSEIVTMEPSPRYDTE
jgi:hypothetical protein